MDKAQEKLNGMIADGIKNFKDEFKEGQEQVKEEISAIRAENSEMKSKVDALINQPAKKVSLSVPGGAGSTKDFMYKGFDLRKQGYNKNSSLFNDPIWKMTNEDLKEDIAKMLIGAIQRGFKGEKNVNLVEKTTLVEGTDGVGGVLVFDEFMNTIRSLGQLYGVMLNEAEVVTMSTDTMHYPVDNDASITVAYKSETTAFADGVPSDVFTEIELNAKRLGAYAILTNDLMNDSGFDIVSFLMQKFSSAISRHIDSKILTTTSDDIFQHLIDAGGTSDSTGTLNYEHLLDAYSKLDSRMYANARFYFNRLVYFGTLLKDKDTTGQPIFLSDMVANVNQRSLMGVPVVLVEDMPYTLNNGLTVGLLANMRQAYVIGQRKGIGSFFFNPYSLDTSEQTRITLGTRWSGRTGFTKSCVNIIY